MDLRAARDATSVKTSGVVTQRAMRSGVLKAYARYTYALQVLVYVAGFLISWVGVRSSRPQRVWLELPGALSRNFGVDLNHAIVGTTASAVLLMLVAAALRTWGAATRDTRRVRSSQPGRSNSVREGLGPQMWIGTVLHTLALCILMSWAGAAFTLVCTLVLQVAFAAAGESRTERTIPEQAPAGGLQSCWWRAFVQEIYFWGAAASFAAFGWAYDGVTIVRGLLVSLGFSIVVRGLVNEDKPAC